MAMVGLFWITEDCVYVGAEPTGTAPGVRLTKDGVEILGLGQGGRGRRWDEIREIDVRDVAVRSAARRLLSMAFDSALVLISGDGEQPPAFTVRVVTETDGTIEASALAAVPGGIHTPDEYALSRALLTRLVDGDTLVDDLLTWCRDRFGEPAPAGDERLALLRRWTASPA
ncbi:hypothetical protein SAM23877_3895 [Streptomyces ambofaciens ATCC 23877]|uniref:Uncharacterized protein n=1 Tax=Streptomyces ambofaciens (strain ATCC 23877 / 3486 / DSM 40053 / JCM 4204 / NBRC 12836 / NRRL B-2516) TaxID=278992 RepID=A0A0K2AUY2_STRA7|nr:hypothetical protein [Streptomyces ambofaciens]AKZ56940.1 hypothetical protein SAM23877_3895 [Streptomyces ambofaciens ATCC 23877]